MLLRQRGEHEAALGHHRRALALARELGNRGGEAEVLDDLAATLHAAGRLADALATHRQSLRLATGIRDRYEQARNSWSRALDRYEVLAVVALGDNGDGSRLLSRMTLKSWTELALAEGQNVYAQVKYVSLNPGRGEPEG